MAKCFECTKFWIWRHFSDFAATTRPEDTAGGSAIGAEGQSAGVDSEAGPGRAAGANCEVDGWVSGTGGEPIVDLWPLPFDLWLWTLTFTLWSLNIDLHIPERSLHQFRQPGLPITDTSECFHPIVGRTNALKGKSLNERQIQTLKWTPQLHTYLVFAFLLSPQRYSQYRIYFCFYFLSFCLLEL